MREPLNRRRILEAALTLVDAEGLAALSMRRLGRELGVEAMSLYRHVPGKQALLDGIVELIILEIDVPNDPGGDWETAWRQIARSYRRAAHAHPDAFPLVAMRPLNTPEALRRLDAALDILRRTGLDEWTTIAVFRTLASFVRGFALEEVTGRALGAQPIGDGDLSDLPPAEFPRLVELAPLLLAPDRDAEYELGVELILAGVRAALAGNVILAGVQAGLAESRRAKSRGVGVTGSRT